MGWAYCGRDKYDREIGYAIVATCDKKGCDREISRGLDYCCGPMHNGDDGGCGRYYCPDHGSLVDDRGRCQHKGYQAWGKTKCQLLSERVSIDRWFDPKTHRWQHAYGSQYYCACHEWQLGAVSVEHKSKPWEDPYQDPTNPLNNWKLLPGFMAHIKQRGYACRMPMTDEDLDDDDDTDLHRASGNDQLLVRDWASNS